MPTATEEPAGRVTVAPLPDLEDADLVRRARDGDERAFDEIVRRYRTPLIRYSARHVGRDNAEDITQHALTKAAIHLRDDPRPIHLRAWLYRVAHNAAINMRTRKDWGHEELDNDIDGVPQPPEVAAQRTEVREVVTEMDRLPDRQRAALLMSVFEGRGYEEIATELHTSPNSVRALLSRARAHLRQAAVAIGPLPLLGGLARKVWALAGTGAGQGTIAAGGTAAQTKLIAVAATTVVAGAATAEQVTSDDPAAIVPPATPVVAVPAPAVEPVPVNLDGMLPQVEAPKAAAPAKARPQAVIAGPEVVEPLVTEGELEVAPEAPAEPAPEEGSGAAGSGGTSPAPGTGGDATKEGDPGSEQAPVGNTPPGTGEPPEEGTADRPDSGSAGPMPPADDPPPADPADG